MDELNKLRKKVLDLEKENLLFKETEKKLQASNQQLQASEQRLISKQETLIQTQRIACVGSWEWDIANDTVSWSDELFQIFKLNPENGAVSYTDQSTIYAPDSMKRLDTAVKHILKTGEPYKMDLEIIRSDGTNAFCTAQAYAKKDKKGNVIRLYGSLQDITERKKITEHLKKIEWLLQPKKKKAETRIPDYGDLTAINRNRTILDSVGKETLNKIVSDYLSLLETSAAVYEENGDYAVGIFSSEWCQFLDCSSRALCKSKENKKALESGKWLCHESCWADASSQSMQTNKAMDIECSGGIHIYAIPIRANNKVIGSINFGYGNPPTNENKLSEIATNYNVPVDKLKKLAQSYETRPTFIIDIAKEKLATSAKLIGNIVEKKRMEEDLLRNQKRYEDAQMLGHIGNWEYDLVSTNFWASDEAKRIYGHDLSIDNYSTETVEKCIPERERVHQALIDLLEHNKEYDLVFDIITHDNGIRKTIHSIAELERDSDGKPIKVTGVINDITEQKKKDDKLKALNQQLLANEQQLKASNQQLQASEEELKALNQQLRAANQQLKSSEEELKKTYENIKDKENRLNLVIKGSNDAPWDWDLIKDELFYSTQWWQQIGYKPNEISPTSSLWGKLMHPEDKPNVDKIFNGALDSGQENYQVEFRLRHKKGHFVPVLSRGFITFNENKKPIRVSGTNLDLTEQKKNIEELKNEKQFLEAVFDSSIDGIVSCDANGILSRFNKATTEFHGLPGMQIVSDEWAKYYDLYFPDGKTPMQKKDVPLFRALTEGFVRNTELMIIPKNGKKRLVVCNGKALKDANGKILGAVVTMHDITEQKRVLQELKESEEKYRALFNNAPLSYQSLDEQGFFIDINPSWLRTLGYEHDEVIGENFADFLHPDWKSHFEKNFPAFKKRGYVNDVEYKIKHKKGHFIDISFEGCIGYLPDGSFKQTYCVFQDITERKKAKTLLLESEEKFRTFVNTASDLMCITNKDGQLTDVNSAMVNILDYSIEELKEMYISNLLTEEALKNDFKPNWGKFIEDGKIKIETTFRTKHGNEIPGELKAIAIYNSKGTITGTRAVFNDLTKRKQAEQESNLRKNLLRDVLDIVPAFICAKNLDGRFILVNKKLTDFYDTTVDEMTGILHADICKDENELQSMLAADREVIENGKLKFIPDETMKNPDGGITFLDTYKIPFTALGEPAVLIASVDITDRKKAEKALIESEQRLKEAQRMASIGYWVQDIPSGKLIWSDETFRIFEVNKEFSGELSDIFFNTIHPEDREAVTSAYNNSLKTRKPYEITHKLQMSDGRIKYVHESCETEYDELGNPIKSIGTVQDVTKLKIAEEELKKHKENLAELVNERTKELKEKYAELERINKLFVGRELRMVELKEKIKDLENKLK